MPVYTRAQLRSTFVHELSPPLSSLISVLPRSNVPRGRVARCRFPRVSIEVSSTMGAVEKVSTAFNRSTIGYIILESVRDVRNVIDRQDFFF